MLVITKKICISYATIYTKVQIRCYQFNFTVRQFIKEAFACEKGQGRLDYCSQTKNPSPPQCFKQLHKTSPFHQSFQGQASTCSTVCARDRGPYSLSKLFVAISEKKIFNNFQNNPCYQQVRQNAHRQVPANGLGLKFLVNLSELKCIEQSQRREKNSRFNVFVFEGHDSWHTRQVQIFAEQKLHILVEVMTKLDPRYLLT